MDEDFCDNEPQKEEEEKLQRKRPERYIGGAGEENLHRKFVGPMFDEKEGGLHYKCRAPY